MDTVVNSTAQLSAAVNRMPVRAASAAAALPEPLTERDYVSFVDEAQAYLARERVPGWGAHGEVDGATEWIDTSKIAADPRHPRDDWELVDDDAQAIERGLTSPENGMSGESGQFAPIQVTYLTPEDPEARLGYTVMCIDGHRVLAAARRAGVRRLLCVVRLKPRSGGLPLSRFERLLLWIGSNSQRPPSFAQWVAAFAQLREAWEQEHGTQGATIPLEFPTQQAIARVTGASQSSVSRAMTIAYQPPAIWQAVADRRMAATAAFELVKAVPEPSSRARLAEAILAESGEHALVSLAQVKKAISRAQRNSYQLPTGTTRTQSITAGLESLAVLADEPVRPRRLLAALGLDFATVGERLQLQGEPIPETLRAILAQFQSQKVKAILETMLSGD